MGNLSYISTFHIPIHIIYSRSGYRIYKLLVDIHGYKKQETKMEFLDKRKSVRLHETPIAYRISKEVEHRLKVLIAKHPEDYPNESTAIRCAIMRLYDWREGKYGRKTENM